MAETALRAAKVLQLFIAVATCLIVLLFVFMVWTRFAHDERLFHDWFWALLVAIGLPLVWATVSVVMLWRGSAIGWCASVLGDAVLMIYAVYLVVNDAQATHLWTRNAAAADLWHPAGALLLMVSLGLLLTGSVRTVYLPKRPDR